MNKSAVFFDIDGTLWDYEKAIPDSTIKAIHQLQQNGHLAFICTGRSRSTVWDERLLGIGFDGIVGGCGTHIEMDGKLLFEKVIDYEELVSLTSRLAKAGVGVFCEGPQKLYIDWQYFAGQAYAESFRVMGDACVGIDTLNPSSRVNKFSIDFLHMSVEELMPFLDESRYHVIIHDTQHMDGEPTRHVAELVPIGYSKATGIARVCEHLGIDRACTYAFGDGSNDVEMLRYAAHGIAMGNGNREAKEAADYITKPLHEDGIYYGLSQMGLI